jgi:hypothetical protein
MVRGSELGLVRFIRQLGEWAIICQLERSMSFEGE